MTASAYKTNTAVCLMVLSLLCVSERHSVVAAPQPIPPGMMYREDFAGQINLPSENLVERLKEIVERKEEKIEVEMAELAEEKIIMQNLLEEKARKDREQQQAQQENSGEDSETLPVPAAVYHHGPLHSGKRTSYMALCHFKICNMGRKRTM